MDKTEVWKKWQMDMKAWRKKRDRDLRITCGILIPFNIILGCCSFYFLFRTLDTYVDRRELEEYPSDGSLELKYDRFFCSLTTYIVCTFWIAVSYAFNTYRRFLPFIRVVCVIAPVQIISSVTAYGTLGYSLPIPIRSSFEHWELFVVSFVASLAGVLSTIGNLTFMLSALDYQGKPKKPDITDIIEMELTKKENEN